MKLLQLLLEPHPPELTLSPADSLATPFLILQVFSTYPSWQGGHVVTGVQDVCLAALPGLSPHQSLTFCCARMSSNLSLALAVTRNPPWRRVTGGDGCLSEGV
ncbi:hypothetical protein JZ751_014391 [Albula glossodonta]|uniref:Uncharacterized protein n=1 Tax=Albula glossodonta TaxID=121402 RepID=A0A8T2N8S7_9TELE|nr:hypothetical protein JZ751_014391 [Albula glossodonta]